MTGSRRNVCERRMIGNERRMKCDDHSGARDIRDIRDIFQGFYDHSFDGDHRRLLTATDQDSSNRSNRQGHPHAWEGTAHQLRHFVGAKGMVCIYIYIYIHPFFTSQGISFTTVLPKIVVALLGYTKTLRLIIANSDPYIYIWKKI